MLYQVDYWTENDWHEQIIDKEFKNLDGILKYAQNKCIFKNDTISFIANDEARKEHGISYIYAERTHTLYKDSWSKNGEPIREVVK